MMIENEINYESIIGLSKKPIENITLLTEIFTENLNQYKNAPSLIRPFLKKDIEFFTTLKEEDWLDFLIRLKTCLEKMQACARINHAAQEKKAKQKTIDYPVIIDITKSVLDHPLEEKEEKLETDNGDFLSSFEKKDTLFVLGEEKSLNKNVYCPECGHKCQGEIGLKIHVVKAHKSDSEKLLKSIKLYRL
jgi:hypothetical protein